MKLRKLLLPLVLFAALVSAQEAGHRDPSEQAHAEEASNPNEIYWKWANFALLLGILGYLASKRAPAFFQGRNAEIEKGIAEATALRTDAERRAADMERRLQNLQDEIAQLRHAARDEMVREAERQDKETAQMLAKIHAQAQHDIETATNVARQELKAYSAQLALDLAEQEVKRRMTPQIQRDLVNRFGGELSRVQGAN